MRSARRLVASLTLLLGCSGEETEPALTTSASSGSGAGLASCAPGELALDDKSCVPAGVPDGTPPAGPEHEPEAGVPANECVNGFVSDGEGGCVAVLPAARCPFGTMAVPGETTCREVAPCAPGTWGDIPTDTTTEFVDGSFVGPSDGSAAAPWTTIQEAADAAVPGAVVAVAAGVYAEDVVLATPVAIWGRCPALTAIAGQATAVATVGDAELHQLALTGAGDGVLANGAGVVMLDRVWIHDTGGIGIHAAAAAEVTIAGTLVESATGHGLYVLGADALFEDGMLRSGQPFADGTRGRGATANYDVTRSSLVVRHSVVEDNHECGISAAGSDLSVESTVVRGTLPEVATLDSGIGVRVLDLMGQRGEASITGSVVRESMTSGIAVYNSDVVVTATTVEAMLAAPGTGYAFGITADASPPEPTTVVLDRSVVRDVLRAAVLLQGAEATIDRALLQRVTRWSLDEGGMALHVTTDSGALVAGRAIVTESVLEAAETCGAFVFGSTLDMQGSVVRDVAAPDTAEAVGVYVGADLVQVMPASALVGATRVEHVEGVGIYIKSATADLDGVHVADIGPTPSGDLGIGIDVRTITLQGALGIHGSLVERTHGWGVLVEGADIDVSATNIRDIASQASTGSFGRCIELQDRLDGPIASGTILLSTIERCRDSGIFDWSSTLEVRGVLIRGVTADDHAFSGDALVATSGTSARRATLTITGSVVDGGARTGLNADAATVVLSGSLVHDLEGGVDGSFGRCVGAQRGADVVVEGSLLERCREHGITFSQSTGRVTVTTVRHVRSRALDGLGGDGIVGWGTASPLELTDNRIEAVDRAGVVSFGDEIRLERNVFECNPIDLDGETYDEPALIVDGGGNVCGCGGETNACAVRSTGLSPPEPLP